MGKDERPIFKVVFDACVDHAVGLGCALAAGYVGGLPAAAAGGLSGETVQWGYQRARAARRDKLRRTDDINYTGDFVLKYYADPPRGCRWLEANNVRTPYHVLVDFLDGDDESWGHYSIDGDFALAPDLHAHRTRKVEEFAATGRLRRHPEGRDPVASVEVGGKRYCDDALPRLRSIDLDQRHLSLQRARYTDQVGTNLTLDAQLSPPIAGASTLRAWDAVGPRPSVPSFGDSGFANTIGVAVAVTARVEGRKVLIVRKRTDQTAVYAGMEGPAVTFALELEPQIARTGSMRRMILDDLTLEVLQELHLDSLDRFHPPKPLALCRDLVRGGKPQYFLELEVRDTWSELAQIVTTWDDLCRKSGVPREFENAGRPREEVDGDAVLSPETEACMVLLRMI